MSERIVITGMGAVTPVGIGADVFWQNLLAGRCGVRRIAAFDTAALPVQIAAEVADFEPTDYFSHKMAKDTGRFMQFAMVAADEAIRQSGVDELADKSRLGVTLGTALDGLLVTCATQADYTLNGRKVGPRFLPEMLGNIAAAQIAIRHGFTGASLTLNTACSSGGDAISVAALLLLSGAADVVTAVGTEAGATPILISSLAAAGALSRRNDAPERASRPFDQERDGFVIGEGGAALVLETESHALSRGAEILAVVAGWANNCDAYHVTAPRPDGLGAAACMQQALAQAGMTPSQIDYINAHGTATPAGDVAEATAIRATFGAEAERVYVGSTKGATGHMMGAGGIAEVIACIGAVRHNAIPPTLNLEHPDPACLLRHVPLTARETEVRAAMSNSFGFGGQNSSIIVSKYLR